VTADGPRSARSSAWRFLVAGGFNTVVTGLLLSFLARLMDPPLAYTLVFALGIVIAVTTAGGFIFGVRLTRRLVVRYVTMYVAVYLVGLAAVALAVGAGMPREWSGLVVLITAPLTFIGGRLLLVTSRGGRQAHERTPV
jgi:putative flippase GtrA